MSKTAFVLIIAAAVSAVPGNAFGNRRVSASSSVASTSRTAELEASATTSRFEAAAWDAAEIGSVEGDVFSLALASAEKAVQRGEADPATLTVIDFSRPSTAPRLWVYDLRRRKLLFSEHVAHGRNSGFDLPTQFSNEPESNMSSIGLYRASESYIGKHGYSLRLDGLEPGFNDRARDRAIVIHGAEYVNANTAKAQGRLGRSLGCPAVRPEIARKLIDAVKDGGLVFAYYPDPSWLQTSRFLN
ncbi:MAG TPA: murein L,D-transpeptidase catalytic domain family protein [Vicinamibacterales bacterium]|nr:murein L,D-transpeptidase catalytic domain family protein [Vicinamibacterales bacterium]